MVAIRQDFLMSSPVERLGRIADGLAELKDDMLYLRMPDKAASPVCWKLELRAERIVRGVPPTDFSIEFDDLLYDACERGAIDKTELSRLIMTDMIISAVSRKSGARAYVAVEASFVVGVRDVSKALDGAEILAKAFPDAETYAAVYGKKIDAEVRAEADKRGAFAYIPS